MDHLRLSNSRALFAFLFVACAFLNDNARGSCSITMVTFSLSLHHCRYHFTDCLDDVDSICDCLKIIFFNIKQTSWCVFDLSSPMASEIVWVAADCIYMSTRKFSSLDFNHVGVNFFHIVWFFPPFIQLSEREMLRYSRIVWFIACELIFLPCFIFSLSVLNYINLVWVCLFL